MPLRDLIQQLPSSKKLLGLLAAALLSALVGLPTAYAQGGPPRVVATVGMIGDVASELAGSCADVRTMIGPGSDPHLYRASAGDVRLLEQADLVLYSGLHLEAGLARVLENFSRRTSTVAVAEEAVAPEQLIATSPTVFDPHVWMDVSLWRGASAAIAAALTELLDDSPDCVQQVRERASAYAALLGDLHGWSQEAIASIPEEQRILVTAHDAFAYFGRAYGIHVEGIQGISTETEAAVADIRRVAQLMVERQIPSLFLESTINPRTVTAVLEAVEQRGGTAEVGSELYADALGTQGQPEGTYVGMVLHNVRAMTLALGGNLPELPDTVAAWEARW